MQAYIGVHTSAWSYNSLIQAWEPILEPWNLIMKADMNTGAMVCSHLGVDFECFLSTGLACSNEVSGWLMVVRMITKLASLQNLARTRLSSIAFSCRAFVTLACMRCQYVNSTGLCCICSLYYCFCMIVLKASCNLARHLCRHRMALNLERTSASRARASSCV